MHCCTDIQIHFCTYKHMHYYTNMHLHYCTYTNMNYFAYTHRYYCTYMNMHYFTSMHIHYCPSLIVYRGAEVIVSHSAHLFQRAPLKNLYLICSNLSLFIKGNKKKSQRARFGEYGECCTCTTLCFTKNWQSKSFKNWH